MSSDENSKDKDLKSKVSKKFIDSMGPYSSAATINWLKDMSEDVIPDNKLLENQNEEPPYMTMVCCLDTLFDNFQRYHWQYNKNQDNQDLRIKFQRPDFTKTIDEKIQCQGSLSTKKWSMLIEAEPDKITVYIVARESLDVFAKRRENYIPLWSMQGKCSDFGMLWRTNDSVIRFEHLSFIAKKLFARITRISKGESSTLEPFSIEIPKQDERNLGSVLNQIRSATSKDNSTEYIEATLDRTTEMLTSLQVMCQQDLQEMTKMGIMALRSGDKDLNQTLTQHTKTLTELTNKLQPVIAYWQNSRA